jgi:hypothetical protein
VSTAEEPPVVPAAPEQSTPERQTSEHRMSEQMPEHQLSERTAEPRMVEQSTPDRPGLNQPWRGLVAAGEVVLAVVGVVFAVVCWHHGVTTMVTPLGNGQPPLVSTIFLGNWMAAGIGLVVVAAFLVLDALRQVLLAVRTRRRPQPPEFTVAPPADLAV